MKRLQPPPPPVHLCVWVCAVITPHRTFMCIRSAALSVLDEPKPSHLHGHVLEIQIMLHEGVTADY